ncbi:hypothetical protein BH20ACT2_BH20ACT2_15390 [soil metagenome]
MGDEGLTRSRVWGVIACAAIFACVWLAVPAAAQYGPTSTTAPTTAPGGGPGIGGTDTGGGIPTEVLGERTNQPNTGGGIPTEVVGERLTNQPNTGGANQSRGGVLPRTGADLLLWLLVALIALAVGRLLVEYSRRRRRSHAV